ncbi:hypothetical protein NDU88_007612 [Pleurodeles waltl]|uniref:Uncharacterized protein n=1 Tax=Pleurodeles waltl TaxID=8319 RepID=A0AAV7RRG1_PLEWA|nr:hypothetical protein NDU88_007612 [Pleurodeles waltl]
MAINPEMQRKIHDDGIRESSVCPCVLVLHFGLRFVTRGYVVYEKEVIREQENVCKKNGGLGDKEEESDKEVGRERAGGSQEHFQQRMQPQLSESSASRASALFLE